jgi:hypothetical protein
MSADTHMASNPNAGGAYTATTSPEAIIRRPTISRLRLWVDVLAKLGSVAAPIEAASHGAAERTPIRNGEKCPEAPMMPGKKKMTA